MYQEVVAESAEIKCMECGNTRTMKYCRFKEGEVSPAECTNYRDCGGLQNHRIVGENE